MERIEIGWAVEVEGEPGANQNRCVRHRGEMAVEAPHSVGEREPRRRACDQAGAAVVGWCEDRPTAQQRYCRFDIVWRDRRQIGVDHHPSIIGLCHPGRGCGIEAWRVGLVDEAEPALRCP